MTPSDNYLNSADDLSVDAAESLHSSNLQSADLSEDAMEVDGLPESNVPGKALNESGDTLATNTLPSMSGAAPPDSDIGGNTATSTRFETGTAIQLAAKATPPVPPVLTTRTVTSRKVKVDADGVPEFLRSHGKGKREVDIFNYLNQVKDPRFQEVLRQYVRIAANPEPEGGCALPTTGRPVEIGQWIARARPSNPPDFASKKRTFSAFIDSVFEWWGSIQPSWRSFKRGQVSREIHGEWDVLYAPQITGLLNVVILAYWWIKILDKGKEQDGVRADYEEFAEDVAWVFSNLFN